MDQGGFCFESATLDDGTTVSGQLQIEAVEMPPGSGNWELYAKPSLNECLKIEETAQRIARRIVGEGTEETLPGAIKEVTMKKIKSLETECATLRRENKDLRRWNKHLEEKLLGFVSLAFEKLKPGEGVE